MTIAMDNIEKLEESIKQLDNFTAKSEYKSYEDKEVCISKLKCIIEYYWNELDTIAFCYYLNE